MTGWESGDFGSSSLTNGSGRPVWNAVAARDGRRLFMSKDGGLVAWDLGAREILYQVTIPKTVRKVAISPDGQTLATAEYKLEPKGMATGPVVAIRDASDGHIRHECRGHGSGINALAFSPDGKVLGSTSWNETEIRRWDVATGKALPSYFGHTEAVTSIAFSPDGKTLASTGHDATVRLWDTATGKSQQVPTAHTRKVQDLAFSPDGKMLVTGGDDKLLGFCDFAQGIEFCERVPEPVLALAFSPDGKTVAVSTGRWGDGDYRIAPGDVVLFDAATHKSFARVCHSPSQVFALAFAPDGRRLVTGNVGGQVRIWHLDRK